MSRWREESASLWEPVDGTTNWRSKYRALQEPRRELGLGAADRSSIEVAGASLKEARKRADEARVQLEAGADPIDLRRGSRRAERKAQAERKAEAKGVRVGGRGKRSAEIASARP